MLEAQIETLGPDGLGRGRGEDGAAVAVPGSLPGERVRFRVEHRGKDGTGYGRLLTVLSPAADRIESACRHFLTCGGCDLLHLQPEAELVFKRSRVADALGVPLERVEATLASPRSLHYRAVAKLVFGPGALLGSYAPRTHRVVDMSGCKIHAPVIERVASAVRRALAEGDRRWAGARYLVLRAALPEERVHATLVTRAEGDPAEAALLETLAGHPEIAEIWVHVNDAEGDSIFDGEASARCLHRGQLAVGRVGSAEQHLAAGAFAQVNPGAAERLYRRVAELVEPADRRVLDLYSGSGGIALTLLAEGAAEVLGIERNPEAVAAAARGAAAFGTRARFEAAPAERVSDWLGGPDEAEENSGGGYDAWVVNPPRRGLAPEVIAAALALLPERIVYVSCQPDRLAEDLAALSPRYRLDAVTPVDLFPRTCHVETVVRLRLR